MRLCGASRPDDPRSSKFVRDYVSWGAGPRGSQNLVLAAKARALLLGRSAPTAEDVRAAARQGAVRQIERARTAATGYLRYRPGLAANLILAAARSKGVFDGNSTNFEALRDELARCRVLPQRLDADRALDLAAKMLAPSGEDDRRRRELVLISDFQRSNWGGADFSPWPPTTAATLCSTPARRQTTC